MNRHVILYAVALPLMVIHFVADVVLSIVDSAFNVIAAPVTYLVKTARAHNAFKLIAPFKLIALRVISQLKPVYRESYLTDGLNLKDRLRPA